MLYCPQYRTVSKYLSFENGITTSVPSHHVQSQAAPTGAGVSGAARAVRPRAVLSSSALTRRSSGASGPSEELTSCVVLVSSSIKPVKHSKCAPLVYLLVFKSDPLDECEYIP